MKSITVDSRYADTSNSLGETLIPPTLYAFAQTFAEDLSSSTGGSFSIERGSAPTSGNAAAGSIFLTVDPTGNYTDAAGRFTGEGYTLNVTRTAITITGASPLGAWWGTRTVLQAAALNAGAMPAGNGKDAPGWADRGIMLDVARKYYPPEFLIEMCAYLGYFKQNTLHLHLSDNVVKQAYLYTEDTYSAFRLDLEGSEFDGLVQRKNESYSRAIFDDLQQKCAARGVTIVPEIEAPGHALVLTAWKPELALEGDQSYLDLENPATYPAIQSVWDAALPWFQSKTVHLGADEYSSSAVDLYNKFVTDLSAHINTSAGKKTRIWGTFPPQPYYESNIPTSVSIQHWEFFEDNPLTDYIQHNYSVVNSDDGFYVVNKYSGSYPQVLNYNRIFNGNPAGGQFAPYIFDGKNPSNNPERSEPLVLGHEAALWNDFGPAATTVTEAYWALRQGLPALGDKQWGGDITMDEYNADFPRLHASIPGQNLDLAVATRGDTILQYDFGSATAGSYVLDVSGNGYDAENHDCTMTDSALDLDGTCYLSTTLDVKGRDYTLAFSVQSTTFATGGELFSNGIYSIVNGNGSVTDITFISEGNAYVATGQSLPTNEWTSVKVVGSGGQTFLTLNNGTQTEIQTTFTDSNNNPIVAQISVPLPLASIGKGFVGKMKDVVVLNSAS